MLGLDITFLKRDRIAKRSGFVLRLREAADTEAPKRGIRFALHRFSIKVHPAAH